MKILFKVSGASVVAALAMAAQTIHAQQTVFANTNTFKAHFSTGSLQVGNEITLAGSYRQINGFAFEYYLPTASGTETADVKFYKNDSTAQSAGYAAPGTVIYDSGAFNIGSFGSQSSATLNFAASDFTTGVVVPLTVPLPDTFTWTVQFGGLGSGEDIGVDLYQPVSIGSAPSDMWEFSGGSWGLVTNATYNLTIGASVSAVPEPSSFLLLAMGGLLGLAIFAVKRHQAAAR